MQGQFQCKNVYSYKQQVEALQTEQIKGCETPEALSSITMVEEIAAMKIIQINTLSTPVGKQNRL